MTRAIPVLDLFAGPGGLGEGFASFSVNGVRPFRISLSIEMDPTARATLKLRAFTRQFEGRTPDAYYEVLNAGLSPEVLYGLFPAEAAEAEHETWCTELGKEVTSIVDRRVRESIPDPAGRPWVLIGGPPCQAYSLVGRSRMRGADPEAFERDPRHFLYREYLRILARHQPAVFVFENVKGLLSSTIAGERIFDRIRRDLERPGKALRLRIADGLRYTLHAISVPPAGSPARTAELFPVRGGGSTSAEGFVVQAERHGIPQARHRVIIVGVKADSGTGEPRRLQVTRPVPANSVLRDLPAIRSRLSREEDSPEAWRRVVRSALRLYGEDHLDVRVLSTGGEFVAGRPSPVVGRRWFIDSRIGGFWNHSSRGHIRQDIERYVFAASFAAREGRSPVLAHFPEALRPEHRNVDAALQGNMFGDRFRVQLRDHPSTTITSHISRDGHYYIHFDPRQGRSLTVREAARLQTFPDNYFFCGSRTAQYHQVGNAVPPLLAHGIAELVYEALS